MHYHKNTNAVVFCLNYLEVNQDSPFQEDESLPQDHADHADHAADETQTQTAGEAEPMTVHFEVNCELQSFSRSY